MNLPSAYTAPVGAVDARFASVDCVFFVIGAQKAGTTWLSRYFLEHPAVSVPYWKENNYWNVVEGRPTPGRMLIAQQKRRETEGFLRKAVAQLGFTRHAKRQHAITLALKAAENAGAPHSAYADLILANMTDQTKAAGELCPQYAKLSAKTFGQMASLSGNTRFIYMLRDPVSRAVSGARHSLRKTNDSEQDESEALSKLLKTAARVARDGGLTHSNYDQTIGQLEKAVSPDNIMYVFFEKLFNQAEVNRICDFLGVPAVPGNVDRKRNDAGDRKVPAREEDRIELAQAYKPVYDFAFSRFGDAVPQKWRESAALC